MQHLQITILLSVSFRKSLCCFCSKQAFSFFKLISCFNLWFFATSALTHTDFHFLPGHSQIIFALQINLNWLKHVPFFEKRIFSYQIQVNFKSQAYEKKHFTLWVLHYLLEPVFSAVRRITKFWIADRNNKLWLTNE